MQAKKLCFMTLFFILATLLMACGTNPTTAPASVAPTLAPTTAAPPATATARPTIPPVATAAATGSNVAVEPSPRPTLPTTAKKGGTLNVFAPGGLPRDLHPTIPFPSRTAPYGNVIVYIANPALLSFNYATFKWEMATAKEVKVDETGKIFTFTLKSGLRWSDSSPMTVEDYEFAYKNASKKGESPTQTYAFQTDLALITSYKVNPTAATIEITMDKVYSRDIALNLMLHAPVPKKIWEGKPYFDAVNNPEILKPTVGAGPYLLDEWNPPNEGSLKVNPNFYGGQPNFEKIVLKTGQANVGFELLKNGQADWGFIQLSQYDEAKATANLNVYDWVSAQGDMRYMEFNLTKPLFQDINLRKAMAYAINRNDLIRLAVSGKGVAQYSFLPPVNPFNNTGIEKYSFDLEKSKKLLSDAGYKLENGVLNDKSGNPVKINFGYATNLPEQKLAATYLQQAFRPIGIEVTVEGFEIGAFREYQASKKYDVVIARVSSFFPDPDSFRALVVKGGSYNNSGYSNSKVEELFDKGVAEFDTTKRKAFYDEIQQIVADELPILPLFSPNGFVAASKKLGGFTPTPAGLPNLGYNFITWYLDN